MGLLHTHWKPKALLPEHRGPWTLLKSALFDWGKIWGLKFNVSKCNMLHLTRQVTKPVRYYTLGGEVISSIYEAKYLGVTLSNNYGTISSQWKPHILDTFSRANQRLGFLHRNLRGSTYKLRETAYLALVWSSLEYCGAIWDPAGNEEIESLEVIQRRAIRWARGANGIISVTALLRDLSWLSLVDQHRDQHLCLFFIRYYTEPWIYHQLALTILITQAELPVVPISRGSTE